MVAVAERLLLGVVVLVIRSAESTKVSNCGFEHCLFVDFPRNVISWGMETRKNLEKKLDQKEQNLGFVLCCFSEEFEVWVCLLFLWDSLL